LTTPIALEKKFLELPYGITTGLFMAQPLTITTYDNSNQWRIGNNFGGNAFFKALVHPLAARKIDTLRAQLQGKKVAVYDPQNQLESFLSLYPLPFVSITDVYVQDVTKLGETRMGKPTQSIADCAATKADTLFVASFDADKYVTQISALLPRDLEIVSFNTIKIPNHFLTDTKNYLAPLNFCTNLALLREQNGFHTAIGSANYWSQYGNAAPRLWLCLFNEQGAVLGEWEENLGQAGSTFSLDSRAIATRLNLKDFTGSLFIHATHIAGHDVMKYAVDVWSDDGTQLSATHDSNPWPADIYGGIPAPQQDEIVSIWLQNTWPLTIPANSMTLNVTGTEQYAPIPFDIPAYGTCAVNVTDILPDVTFPQQLELHSHKYVVRPRHEITRNNQKLWSHSNVKRTDLTPDPALATLAPIFGKGFILPIPILPTTEFTTTILPTPMATCQTSLPLTAFVYNTKGQKIREQALGLQQAGNITTFSASDLLGDNTTGHLELAYDFTHQVAVDGWLHALARVAHRSTSHHQAETSFGAHLYNSAAVYKNEPQSYTAAAPGLTTRLFLRLAPEPFKTACHLIYPVSKEWREHSSTTLILKNQAGDVVAETGLTIPANGSLFWYYQEVFDAKTRSLAGDGASLIVRDTTCRLFGFHAVVGENGTFSLDHMFGF
jgi:hypothetical protein